jgi:hypothetical protein
MSNDMTVYQFSRSKVERGDFSHFLTHMPPHTKAIGINP